MESLNQIIKTEIPKLQNKLKILEDQKVPEDTYFKTATKLNKLVYYTLPVAITLFVLGQTSLTIFLYMYFVKDSIFNGYVTLIINSVGLFGIFEIIWLYFYLRHSINSIESKITRLEEKR